MNAVSYNDWVLYALVFLLGLVIGMALMAGGKWKHRYRDESRRRTELETENKRLRTQAAEMDTLRHAAARDTARHEPGSTAPL